MEMADRDQDGPRGDGVQNADVFREACSLFGEAGARARLRAFQDELAQQLSWIAQGGVEAAALGEMAHRTVGRAGFLGFHRLVEASVDLDEAVRRNGDIAPALACWTREARSAVAVPPGPGDPAPGV